MQKHQAKVEAQNMMKMIADEGKLTDYAVCYHKKLERFKDKKFISSICKKYYGEHVFWF